MLNLNDLEAPFEWPEFKTSKEYMEFYLSDGTDAEHQQLLDEIMATAVKTVGWDTLTKHRQSIVQIQFSMEYSEFIAQYDAARMKLMQLADAMMIEYSVFTTSYAMLLQSCVEKIVEFPELMTVLQECDEEKDLFEKSLTLLSFEEEHTMLRSIIYLNKPITWALNKVKSSKCSWCTKAFAWVKNKACTAAGTAICKAVIAAVTEGIGTVVSGKICGSPINLGKWLGKICSKLVSYVGSKTGITATKACSHISLGTFTIPAHHGAVVDYDRHSITIGSMC
eukprot:UN02077